MRKSKLFSWVVLGMFSFLVIVGCESKVLISTPIADAGPDQAVAKSVIVNLDGSGSLDPNGDPLTYLWTMTARPLTSAAVLSSTTLVNPTFVADVDGTYTIQLVVNDGKSDSPIDTVVITVANTSPVAVAGGPSPVDNHPSNTVTLSSVGSTDANGDPITYLWTMTARPLTSVAVLNDPTFPAPAFVADLAGTYSFSLVVNDGTTDSNTATVDITAINTAPVAVATISVPTIHTGEQVILDAGTSTDINADVLSYVWAVTINPGGNALSSSIATSPTFTPTAAGLYEFTLVATDDDPVPLSSAPVTVGLTANNAAPVAEAGPATMGSHRGAIVDLDGSASYDPDPGDTISYAWSATAAGAGTFSFSATNVAAPTFTSDATLDEVYTIQLMVSDLYGGSSTDTIILTTTANVAPVANGGSDQNVPKSTTVPVALDGSGSTDANGDALTYAWTFTADPGSTPSLNPSALDAAPTFIANLTGVYTIDLLVDDGALTSAPSTVTITTTNNAPVANAGADQFIALGATATLDGSGSTDANDDTLTYAWTFTGVPGGSTITDADLSSTSVVGPTFTPDVIGSYTLDLVVTDNDNVLPASSPIDSVVVTVILPVQDTGQTTDHTGNFGEDSDYPGVSQSFTSNGDGTVTDNVTGLMWQQVDDDTFYNWAEATGNPGPTDVCGNLDLPAGSSYGDWRLPTVNELLYIANYEESQPAVNGTIFPGIVIGTGVYYWSSTPLASSAVEAWVVDFSSGGRTYVLNSSTQYVRCVRGTVTAAGIFVDNGDNTVTDTTTALVWQQHDDDITKGWGAALNYCEGLNLAGTGDWRLPNIKELASLADLTQVGPSVTNPPFSTTDPNFYWSSTTEDIDVAKAWGVYFNRGDIGSLDKSGGGGNFVRCVRGGP